MQGSALAEKPIDFDAQQLEYIHLRATEDLEMDELAERIGVSIRTITRWNKHGPFQDAIIARWQRRNLANATLAGLVHNRCLIELERRTREKKIRAMTLKELQDTVKAVKDEHTGSIINIGGDVNITAGSLADVCARERQEIERTQDICDSRRGIGSLVDQVTGDWEVPSSTPPGETGSQN